MLCMESDLSATLLAEKAIDPVPVLSIVHCICPCHITLVLRISVCSCINGGSWTIGSLGESLPSRDPVSWSILSLPEPSLEATVKHGLASVG